MGVALAWFPLAQRGLWRYNCLKFWATPLSCWTGLGVLPTLESHRLDITLIVIRPHRSPASNLPGAPLLHSKCSCSHWLHSCVRSGPILLSDLILSIFSTVPGFQPHLEHASLCLAVPWDCVFTLLCLEFSFPRHMHE